MKRMIAMVLIVCMMLSVCPTGLADSAKKDITTVQVKALAERFAVDINSNKETFEVKDMPYVETNLDTALMTELVKYDTALLEWLGY